MQNRSSLSARMLDGDTAALARLLTHVENDDELARQALDRLLPHTGRAHLVGITGPPGAGKSTLVNELIHAWRARGNRVAVIAIDPTSPLTGGATLGDRIRMMEWHGDDGVFIRSMASRRHGGGLAQNTLAVAHVFDAAGFDPIIIETVGTGQDEVAIASLAWTTLLVQVPGMGDSVQTLKAGALEIGDILVIAKADRPEANDLARDLRRLKTLHFDSTPEASGWDAPVVSTSAVRSEGIDRLMEAIHEHQTWLEMSGQLDTRRRQIISTEIIARVQAELEQRARDPSSDGRLAALIDDVLERRTSAHRAAKQLLAELSQSGTPRHDSQ